MSLFDILNSDKDKAALNAVIDHAVQALVGQLVPAVEAAGKRLIDQFADRLDASIAKANTAAQSDLKLVVSATTTLMHEAVTELTATLAKLDGASVVLSLGAKQTGGI